MTAIRMFGWACFAALAIAVAAHALAQDDANPPLGGASKPRPVPGGPVQPNGQYKRIGQWAMTLMLEGRPAEAVAFLNEMRDALAERDRPGALADLYFLLALAHGQAGDIEAAERAMNRAIDLGLPRDRFIAGPRDLIEPLKATPTWQAIDAALAKAIIHGPTVGHTTDRSATIWVRTARPATVHVIATHNGASIRSNAVATTEASDYTAVVRLDDLEPRTEYTYRVFVDGEAQDPTHTFRTFPRAGESRRFTIAFGGGGGYVPWNERMWATIAAVQPDALLLLGDNIYSDNPERQQIQDYCYYRRQSNRDFRALVSRQPVYAIWDDHDFSTDDSWGGPLIDVPSWKQPVWRTFKRNWANPSYGGGDEQPGVWHDFVIGDVHFIMLDGRYYRTDSGRAGGEGVEQPSMLGPAQKAWLKRTLAASTGAFKVIASPVPWTLDAKPGRGGLDTWAGFEAEREEIFTFIEQNKIEGVVLLSADRHRSDAWRIERPTGYDFFEFNSSRLTNQHVHGEMKNAIFSYNKKQSFGRVTFDTESPEPTVTYDIITIDGEKVHSLTVKRSDLTFDARNE